MIWSPQVAVLIPCLDEEAAIARVVADFRRQLPDAVIFVYDNGSSDRTMDAARTAGAVVRRESLRGKGNVVRRMFADIEVDIYLLVDGDDTYDAQAAQGMIDRLVSDSLDMMIGARDRQSELAFRRGHRFGNRLLTGLVARFFGGRIGDLLSDYRVMSRRFVKSFPGIASAYPPSEILVASRAGRVAHVDRVLFDANATCAAPPVAPLQPGCGPEVSAGCS